MLLAPFALTETARSSRRTHSPRRTPHKTPVPAWLITWLVGGAVALLLVPALRGGAIGGGTMPFWLVVAPLIDIMWLTRARWMAKIGRVTWAQQSTRVPRH